MISASYLLIAIGFLGAYDVWRYHTVEHALHSLPSARWELVSHALRGPTYAVLFLAVPNLQLRGAWFGALLGLLAIDLAISAFDFSVEKASRAPVGGLPTGEYLLHSAIAILFGALCAVVWIEGRAWLDEPTSLTIGSDLAWPARALLAIMSVGVFLSGALDALAVLRLGRGEIAAREG